MLCDCVGVPVLDHIMCYAFRGDNYGPAGVNETEDNFKVFGKTFPNAAIEASSLDAFYKLLDVPAVRETLPVLTSEIGDTWLFGVAGDPLKAAQMRAMMRIRTACVNSGDCTNVTEPGLARFTHLMLKSTEHTWYVNKAVLTWQEK